ncbi:MAG: fused MFS/spermidine synthase [Flavipsychrobacter sp.]
MLELFIYRGQFQLATEDALYSDGKRYKPMKMAFKHLKAQLHDAKEILFLGGGLCSGIQMLEEKSIAAQYTVVEIDDNIIDYAKAFFDKDVAVRFICADAQEYMRTIDRKYDLIVVDIFNSRVPAEFVTEEGFLLQCRNALNNGGSFVLNYIVNGYPLWEDALEQISTVFPSNTVLKYDINRIVIATV